MKIPVPLKILVLMLAATAFYTYVGQLVPQKSVDPPPEAFEIADDISRDELLTLAQEIMESKGQCFNCHSVGNPRPAMRYPDLGGVGGRAATTIQGLNDLQYLVQSMLEPDEYIVPGFTKGMPKIDKPPIGLTDQEIIAVITYLQSLGGEITVKLDTDIRDFEALGQVSAQEAAAAETGTESSGGQR